MAHNPVLADIHGVSLTNRDRIDKTHLLLEVFLEGAEVYEAAVYKRIENMEYYLQGLWGFGPDPSKHTWKHRYKRLCNEQKLPNS